MDFAKRQLEKYGWTEGKGLGKNENGMSEALKPKLKFDTTGIGHDPSEEFTFNWWENVYNNAADNININTNDGQISIGLKKESVNITTTKYSISVANKNKGLEYGTFLKTAKLTADGVVEHENKVECSVNEVVKLQVLTDDDLFKACGGRTAHKAARHGLKLTGKEARLARQENDMKFLSEIGSKCKKTIKKMKKIKKRKKDKERLSNVIIPKLSELTEQMISESTELKADDKNVLVSIVANNVKKKKKSKKSVETPEPELKETKKGKENKSKKVKTPPEETATSSERLEPDEAEHKRKRKQDVVVDAWVKHCNRYEELWSEKSRRKLKVKRRKEVDKITEMFDNVSLDKELLSEDDGFEEGVYKKKIKISTSERKKKKKKKSKKVKPEDGFDDLMSEIKHKLCHAVELRKELNQKKKDSDSLRIDKMSEDLTNCTLTKS